MMWLKYDEISGTIVSQTLDLYIQNVKKWRKLAEVDSSVLNLVDIMTSVV